MSLKTRRALHMLLVAREQIASEEAAFICWALPEDSSYAELLAYEMRQAVLKAIAPHYSMRDWLSKKLGRVASPEEAKTLRVRWLDSWIAAHRKALGD